MSLSSIIHTLENTNGTEIEKKKSAYKSLLSYLKSDFLKKKELQKYAPHIFDAVKQDVLLDAVIVVLALEVLQICLKEIHFESFDFVSLLQSLLQGGPNIITPEATVLLLRCLNQQNFLSDQIITEMLAVLDVAGEKSLTTAQYALLVEETVELLFNYEKKVGDMFRVTSPAWAFYTIPALGSPSTELRQKAFHLLDKYFVNVLNMTLIRKRIIKCLNIGMAVSLKKLMLKDPIYVIDVWILLIKLVGKEIHKGSTINAMLEIIEIGFKSSAEIRSKAFVAWRHLIDNFALDEKVIGDQKRINLLMLVLKIDNAKVESVAKEKLFTWWHFVKCLGSRLSANLEQIVYPLVQFCLGSCSNAKLGLTSSGSKLSSPKNSNPVSAFPSVQQLGFEVLAHVVGKLDPDAKLDDFQWTLEPLNCYEATSLNFVRHSPFIFTSLQELFDAVGRDTNQTLLLYIWFNLGSQVKAVLENKKCREVFSNFMSLLHFIVHHEKVETDTAMKMVIKSCEFPQKVLAATAYNIICKGATLKACPAQLLIEILLTPVILNAFKSKADYISVFLKLVTGGVSNAQGALFFVQNVSEMLSSQASLLQAKEMLFQIWTELAQLLHSHLIMTNEVNQGDALDHNFDCLFSVLSLPFKHNIARALAPGANKTLFKVWKELYQTFARLSALVPTAEVNICMEQLCARLITLPTAVETLSELEFWVMACYQMIESADFTPFTHQQLSSGGAIGSYNMKKRHRTLGCFNSIVHIVAELLTKANDPKILKNGQEDILSNTLSIMVDICTQLFCHINGSFFIQKCFELLTQPLAEIFKLSASDKLKCLQSSLSKVEKLWHEISVCLKGRYLGILDADFLVTVAPLFEVNFMHTSNIIQNETVSCWNSTFGRLSNLVYPESLNSVLKKVNEKKPVKLFGPGSIPFDENAVIAETPFSDVIMDDSPVPNIMPSPKRQRGSLLGRDVSPHRTLSPSPKSSPVRVINPKSHNLLSSAKKNIALDFMREDDFVVINSPSTRKKRILTEHQKEVLKEKRVIPAMYNNLDASQDVSLGAHFILDTQHESDSVADIHFGRSVSNTTDLNQASTSNINDTELIPSKSILLPQRVLNSSEEKALEDTTNFAPDTNDLLSSTVLAAKTQDNTEDVNEKVLEEKQKSLACSVSERNQNFTSDDKESNLLQDSGRSFEMLNCEAKDLTINGVSVSQDTGLAALSSSKLKNKLRDIQSQDDQADQSPKIKPPRRVPLKKISDINFEPEKTVAKIGISSAEKYSNAAATTDAADITFEDKKSSPSKKLSRGKFSGTPHRARKLFLDPKPVSSVESIVDQKKIEQDSQAANDTSSQGFNSELSELQSTNAPVSEGLSESENLFSSNQESKNEYFLEQMPTLLPSFAEGVDPSAEESGTSSGTSSAKTVSSSESSFNPSQSTLKEDSPVERRKRKSKVPKKYSPNIRAETRRRKCKVVSENKKKSVKSVSDKVGSLSVDQYSLNLSAMSTNSASKFGEHSTSIITKCGTPETKQAKLGEVTPNLKSPNNENPIQTRHSSVKRKGRLSKRLARESTSEGHYGLNAYEVDNLDSNESSNKSVTRKRRLLNDVSPNRIKRKYTRKSVSPKFQQMFKSRSRATRQIASSIETSPAKKRKLRSDLLDSSDDNLPLIVTKSLMATEQKNKKCNIVHALEKPLLEKVTTMNISDKSQLIDYALNSALSQISASFRQNSLVNTETTTLSSEPSLEISEKSMNSSENLNVDIILTDHLFVDHPTANSESSSSNRETNEHNSDKSDTTDPPVPDRREEEIDVSEMVSHVKPMHDEACTNGNSQTADIVLFENVSVCGNAESENIPIKETEMETELQINDSKSDWERVDSAINNSDSRPEGERVDFAIKNCDTRPDGERADSAINNCDSRPGGESVDNSDSRPNGESVDNSDSRPDGESVDFAINNSDSRHDGESVDSAINNCDSRPYGEIEFADAKDLSSDINKSLQVQDCVFVNSDCSRKNLNATPETEESLGKMEQSFHDWSPSKSPNFSILKKTVSETPPSAQSRRVSFAEPVVSGESPVREKYHFERMANSTPREGSKARTSLFCRQLKNSYRQKRKFEPSPKKLNWEKNCDITKKSQCPDSSLQSQTFYKATQESQLSSAGPVFPELVECKKPLDDILPQLTSSFWYRGLCQLMKGRNLNTIGDLCNLTEVQINQLPFRTPKVQTVKTTLIAYMAQHGLNKTKSSQLDDVDKEPILTIENEDSHVCTTSKMEIDCQQPSDIKRSTLIADIQNLLAEIQESGLKTLSTNDLFVMQATAGVITENINKEIKDRFVN